MTTLKLDTLSDRIKAHKNALVHIVKPPVCTERARHYTEAYQQHLRQEPVPVRPCAGPGPSPRRTHYLDQTRRATIIGNRQAKCAAPIFPEYTVSWIERNRRPGQ
ncbi:pyruvate formate lyase family protein [Shigella flexneri]